MNRFIIKAIVSTGLVCLSIVITPVQAAPGVGKAIISIGSVVTTSKDGVEKKLKRRGKVFEGDTIKVGNKSRVQLRFVDNQLVVLKANTVFRIDEYKFKDKKDQNKSAALSLLKGGMRSITGAIGKSSRDKYKVKTPVATMGVRGTHYVIQICDGQCGAGVKGIVGTVLEGSIVMANDGGSQEFGTDQFFNVPSQGEAPKTITNPPTILISRAGTTTTSGEDDGTTSTGDDGGTIFTSGDQSTVTTTTGVLNTSTQSFIVGTPAPAGAGLAIAGISPGDDGAGGIFGREGINALIDLATVNGVGNQPVSSIILDAFGSAEFNVLLGGEATEQGGDGMLGINWGRWASSDVEVEDNGVPTSLLTGLAFVYSPNITPQSAIDSRMDFTTYSFAAGPSFRDETGALVTGSLFIDIDFSANKIVAFGGGLSGNGRIYSGITLDGVMDVPLANLASGGEIPIMSGCSGCPAGISILHGSAGGALVGPNAEAFIGYFGLGGSGVDGMGNPVDIGVSGAGKFDDIGGGA